MKTKILILALIYLLLLGSVFSAEKKEIANIDWRELFTEPSEIVYVIMKDGATFPCTSKHEVMVDMSIGRLEEKLRKVKGKNYSIKEIAIIIHNHRKKKSFSRSDYKQYWTLKSYGFDGRFLLYCHMTNKTYNIEDKTD
ncbi:hypothetical protein ES703_93239 [subsurface metagenome]|nr:hypothetical protein [bacterium]